MRGQAAQEGEGGRELGCPATLWLCNTEKDKYDGSPVLQFWLSSVREAIPDKSCFHADIVKM